MTHVHDINSGNTPREPKSPARKKTVTERQLLANRANAQKSTGPASDQGKAAARFNGLKHGMTAKTVCLPSEDMEYYDALRKEYHRIFQPANLIEHDLVDVIVLARWREVRSARAENSLIRESFAQHRAEAESRYKELSLDVETALAFKHLGDDSRTLDNLDRYERRLRRNSLMAMRQLEEYRRNFPPSTGSGDYTPIYLETENLQTKPIPENGHQPIGDATLENTIEIRPNVEDRVETPSPTSKSLISPGPESTRKQEPQTAPTTELTTDYRPLTTSAHELTTDHRPLTTGAPPTTAATRAAA